MELPCLLSTLPLKKDRDFSSCSPPSPKMPCAICNKGRGEAEERSPRKKRGARDNWDSKDFVKGRCFIWGNRGPGEMVLQGERKGGGVGGTGQRPRGNKTGVEKEGGREGKERRKREEEEARRQG